MVFEPIYFLGILTSRKPLSIFEEYVHLTILNEEFEVKGCVTLSDCSIVEDSLATAIPGSQIKFILRILTFAKVVECLNWVELAILNSEK